MVSIMILYYNIMGPPWYMRSVVDQNVATQRMAIRQMVLRAWLSPWAGCTEMMTLSCILILLYKFWNFNFQNYLH